MYEVQHKQAHWVMNARKANNLATHNAQTYKPQKLKNLQTHQLKNLNRYFLFYNSAQIFSPF